MTLILRREFFIQLSDAYLKFELHILRGIPWQAAERNFSIKGTTYKAASIAQPDKGCEWYDGFYGIDMNKPGSQEYYNSIFELYAKWGVDFVKVDDISPPYHRKEIEAVRIAINKCGRKMVLSLSPGDETKNDQAEHLRSNSNMWRISSDFWDNWKSLKHQFELCHQWENFIGKGHWPDADMIPIGLLSQRGPEDESHRSLLTTNEQKTLMTLWSIFRSPLIYGGDLTMIRPLELKLLTNSEVIAVNQNSEHNRQLFRTGDIIAWIADLPGTNDKYLAIFNLSETEDQIEVNFKELGLGLNLKVRDLWSQKNLGNFVQKLNYTLSPHCSALFKIVADSVKVSNKTEKYKDIYMP